MATSAAPSQIAAQARRLYVEELVRNLAALVQVALEGSRSLIEKPAEHSVFMRRRDLMQELQKGAQAWHRSMVNGLRHALVHGISASRPGDLPPPGRGGGLTLVDDDTIELEIVTSRLALAIMDRASWEFSDLRSRVATLEGRTELEAHDLLRAHVLARVVFDAWRKRRHHPDQLARAAAGAARRVRPSGRRGLSRHQPLVDRAACVARGRPAAVHSPLSNQPAGAAGLGCRDGCHTAGIAVRVGHGGRFRSRRSTAASCAPAMAAEWARKRA